ncbi:protein adenylyltransferase SelO, mitochondrial-like isoform X2 [Pecten maximus]|uniref:protein adenylyltransferase SelO, mitochondrial-like isoform X2 n=1 Tax=Pecten maximus TaxID=6579 RepID=UPI00145820B5|nr:protein adenylyltransferase SelO, mitochondrial-like isoform X2 [Pecten maximus]
MFRRFAAETCAAVARLERRERENSLKTKLLRSLVGTPALCTWRCIASFHRSLNNMSTLETLNFDNLVLRSLPIDTESEIFTRQVSGACFSKMKLSPVENPTLVCHSSSALSLLDLKETEVHEKNFCEYFAGNKLIPGSEPAAHCYCGHQFGYFSGQLGDGAAMYLGEVVNKKGERWEIQLKGSGLTPYSRTADGRKVLRSTIREFLCSEAIFNLGIPTTRAGSCVTSDSRVLRDIFYDGHPIHERCTIVLRIAPTFLRFGSFEIFKPMDPETGRKGPSVDRTDILIQMLDYTIKTFYTEIWDKFKEDKQKLYLEFFREVVRRTARLVADWQCVGWCHGVLNTDNMSICGVTIDYGPYGFMDRYDPDFICNASDDGGRYTYQKQPEICKWNCQKLAEAIKEAIPLSETEKELGIFDEEFSRHYTQKMRRKLGLLNTDLPEDGLLVEKFMETMKMTGADFTNCFRCLSRLPLPGSSDYDSAVTEVTEYILSQCATVEELKTSYKPTMDPRQLQMFMMLMQTNPGILNALGRGFSAFVKEIEKMEKAKELQDMTQISKTDEDRKLWTEWFLQYTERLKLEAKDCSDLENASKLRSQVMNSVNPRFILRNYIAENAIRAAEKGDYSEVQRVLKLLENPFSEADDLGDLSELSLGGSTSTTDADSGAAGPSGAATKGDNSQTCDTAVQYDCKPPEWAQALRVS